jgi:hypothetical protein
MYINPKCYSMTERRTLETSAAQTTTLENQCLQYRIHQNSRWLADLFAEELELWDESQSPDSP